jgi:hypothetical protein
VIPYIAAFCVFVACVTVGCSQPSAGKDLYEKLAKGPDQVKALETVLKTPDEYSADVLYAGAGVAFKEKRLEDSAFLFYAGQLRARFDQKCFPAKGTGGDSPFLAYAALSQSLGSTINPAVMAEPKAFAKAIDRLKNWSPKAPKEYTPGYEFTERLSEKDAHEAARPNRTEFLSRMGDLSTLLNDAEYFAAFRVIQAYKLACGDKRPTKEENEKATETMKRIEKDKNLKGFFSK